VSIEEQEFDAQLRSDLGAADVRDIVVVAGKDLESVLGAAEKAAAALDPLIDAKVIARYDTPTLYLPSAATQEARRSSLPASTKLRDNLRQATAGLAVRPDKLQPFLEDAEAARHGALLSARDLRGTSMNSGFESMILHQKERWNALLPLHSDEVTHAIDLPRVAAALQAAHLESVRVLDLKQQSDALYNDYLSEAIRLSFAGFAALTVLLLVALRSPLRVLRVLLPLALAVLTVAALLVLGGAHFTILHLVGMLLIVAVGSNYALFFDRQSQEEHESRALTLASLAVANAGTVIGFGLLSFSQVPVLVALGTTVAPGALLALLFAALLARA
jgi:predicted exporter